MVVLRKDESMRKLPRYPKSSGFPLKKILRLAIDATPTISWPDCATATRWACPSTSIMEKKLGLQSVVSEMRPDMEFLLIRAHICASSSSCASRTTVLDGNLRKGFLFLSVIFKYNYSHMIGDKK